MEKAVPPSHSFVQMTELILPHHMNAQGSAFGGVIVSWIDIAASISAGRHCSRNVVTAGIDDLHFLAPVYKGDVVNLKAHVNYAHKTSMEVEVKVTAEDIKTKDIRHTVSAYLTFVALNENQKPIAVPALLIQTEEEKKRFEQAKQRRKWRLQRRKNILL